MFNLDAPLGFIIGTHFLITNGAFPDELSLWRLNRPHAKCPTSSATTPIKFIDSEILLGHFSSFKDLNEIPDQLTRLVESGTQISSSHSLSETKSLKRHHLSVPPFRDVKTAVIDPDCSMLFACSSQPTDEFEECIHIWDFRVSRSRTRIIEKFMVDTTAVWLCYEEVND